MDVDQLTRLVRAFISILLSEHKLRTIVGVLIGLVIEAVRIALTHTINSDYQLILAAVPDGWPALSIGLLLAYTPLVFQAHRLMDSDRVAIDIVEELIQRGDLSKADRKFAYRAILERYVKTFNPDATKEEGERLVTSATKDILAERSPPSA